MKMLKAVVMTVAVVFMLEVPSYATLTMYEFTGMVMDVDTTLSGFPTVLEGISVGDPLFGSYSYDGATSPSTNPFSGIDIYDQATYYQVPNTFSLTINGVSVSIGNPILSVFVWNDAYGYDGFEILNGPMSDGLPYYLKFGEWYSIHPSTFSDESLPTTSLGENVFGLYNSDLTNRYLLGYVPALDASPVPIPPAIYLMGSGLVGLIGIKRRMKKQ